MGAEQRAVHNRAAPTRLTGRSWTVVWGSPHAEGRYWCRFARGSGTTRSRPLPAMSLAGRGSIRVDVRPPRGAPHGVPHPPELDPTVRSQ